MGLVSGIAVSCFVCLLWKTDVGSAATWSYDGENGPHFWHELFPQACSGKHQSPIDIRPAQTRFDPSLNDFAIWYDPPRPGSTLVVSNNGHTVQVVTNGEFYVANGGLPFVYRTTQFHFHWGHAKHHGSEHLINNKAFPLELHIVSYNSDLYSEMREAVTEKQGLAILAVLFKISDKDNEDLEPIIKAMQEVRDPEAGKKVEIEAMSLRKLLPKDFTQYYRYNGSVTTPGCFESVVWTIFAQPRPISHRQMHKFRQLLQPRRPHHGGKANYRPRRSASVTSYHYDVKLFTRRQRRRERRAIEVLDELALSLDQTDRFRREVAQAKEKAEDLTIRINENHAEGMTPRFHKGYAEGMAPGIKTNAKNVTPRIDEDDAGLIYRRMLEAVHQSHSSHVGAGKAAPAAAALNNVSELEMEYIQEKLVNNFRSVQPLNDRQVFRSFREVPETILGGSDADAPQRGGSEAAQGSSESARLQDGVGTSAAAAANVYYYYYYYGRGLVSGVSLVLGCVASVLLL